jgi:DNA helicase HerA-like ATPase
MVGKSIGTVIAGSLQEGLLVRLAQGASIESIKTGKFVTVYGSHYRFISLITDLRLTSRHQEQISSIPQAEESLFRIALTNHDIHTIANIRPLLLIDENNSIKPVTTIPHHFADVRPTSESDLMHIFGSESDSTAPYFAIGSPVDMKNMPICVNLTHIAERSTGIFGKTGTGKTFVTRLILAGLISKKSSVCLIFDMHSEYAYQARKEQSGTFVKGLKTLFPQQVVVFSLDPQSTRRRGFQPDDIIELSYTMIRIEDLISLQEELNLHPTACEAAYLVAARYQHEWLSELLAHGASLKELAQKVGAHPESLAALYRKIKPIEKLACIVPKAHSGDPYNCIERMLDYITQGKSIIIEFGTYSSTFCYLLIANIITRRIHALYTAKTEQFLGSQRAQDAPQQLIIVIEEAHKFLNPIAARQTPFGIIAREMRKYYVSLLIVDQRPSGIDTEILSQIGTKFIAQLNDDRDITAVLAGAAQNSYLRALMSSLASKQQIIALGHALPMPMLIETRPYDEKFYQALMKQTTNFLQKDISDLY